ncbi:tumor necrosis factor receptor superfamily member 5-like [Hypanus sabinus]|uniref:tumor necrosis factor receptor superfamily member 5-like n=1 Tax=Hypanus sabinus TaxID=79690 RepID=UPI0028C46672|nr:tumor necrosis factor receptor superfamily member 5-like [Hypanus sabinus]
MLVAVNCSATQRTRCRCRPGHYCVGGPGCPDCEAHSPCGPGRQVTQPGTLSRDTECGECPLGTFKAFSSLEPCQNHTSCREKGLTEIAPGTDISDAECGPALSHAPTDVVPVAPTKSEQLEMDGRGILIPVLILSSLSVCSFLILLLLGFRRRFVAGRTEKNQSPADADQTSVESDRPLLGRGTVFHEPHRQTIHGPEQVDRHRESQQTQQQQTGG